MLLLLNYGPGEMIARDGPSAKLSQWSTLLVGIDLKVKLRAVGSTRTVRWGGIRAFGRCVVEVIAVGEVVRRTVLVLGSGRDSQEGLSQELVWDFLRAILQRFGIEWSLFSTSFKWRFETICMITFHFIFILFYFIFLLG